MGYKYSRGNESSRKEASWKGKVVGVLVGTLAVGALASVPYLANSFNKSAHEANLRTAIESGCRLDSVVAGEGSNYTAWAAEALGPESGLTGKLNRDNVYDIISIANDGREVVSGKTYEILRCD